MLQRIVPIGNGAQDTDATAATVPLSDFYDGASEPELQELLPREWQARRQNRGLEGLAMSADGTKLYAMMQNPLDTRNNSDIDPLTAGTQDLYKTFGYGDSNGVTGGRCDGVTTGPENTGGAGSTNFYRNVRIVELDISSPSSPVVTGEFIYRLDQQNAGDSAIQGRQRMSDIAWAGPRKLIVDEHDDDALAVTGTAVGRRLHEVDLDAATNLATDAAYDTFTERATRVAGLGGHAGTQPIGCYLDGGTAAELAALPSPVTPAAKSTYLDIGSAPAGIGFEFGKPEGVTLLDGMAGVAIVNDNDFGFDQPGGPHDLAVRQPDRAAALLHDAAVRHGADGERHGAGRPDADVHARDVHRHGLAVGRLRVAARRGADRGCGHEPPDALDRRRRRDDQLPGDRHAGRRTRARARGRGHERRDGGGRGLRDGTGRAGGTGGPTGPAGPAGPTGPAGPAGRRAERVRWRDRARGPAGPTERPGRGHAARPARRACPASRATRRDRARRADRRDGAARQVRSAAEGHVHAAPPRRPGRVRDLQGHGRDDDAPRRRSRRRAARSRRRPRAVASPRCALRAAYRAVTIVALDRRGKVLSRTLVRAR